MGTNISKGLSAPAPTSKAGGASERDICSQNAQPPTPPNTTPPQEKAGRQQQQERIAGLGGGSTILLFVGGLSSSSTRDTAADAFLLAVEMLKGGNKKVQVCERCVRGVRVARS